MTVELTETRKTTGDIEIVGVDSEGRRSMCLASALSRDAIAGARSFVLDDLYMQARQEIVNAVTSAKDDIVAAAIDWYMSAGNREAALAGAVQRLRQAEQRMVKLGPLPSSQPTHKTARELVADAGGTPGEHLPYACPVDGSAPGCVYPTLDSVLAED